MYKSYIKSILTTWLPIVKTSILFASVVCENNLLQIPVNHPCNGLLQRNNFPPKKSYTADKLIATDVWVDNDIEWPRMDRKKKEKKKDIAKWHKKTNMSECFNYA